MGRGSEVLTHVDNVTRSAGSTEGRSAAQSGEEEGGRGGAAAERGAGDEGGLRSTPNRFQP
eukprot:3687515-Rhodomonas_salina.1